MFKLNNCYVDQLLALRVNDVDIPIGHNPYGDISWTIDIKV